MILLDTNIIIELLKGNAETLQRITEFKNSKLAISAVTLMELYFGAFNKRELLRIKKAINHISVIQINQDISSFAVGLMESFSKSHNLSIPDALIAATSIKNKNPLLTYNIKDFKFIESLELVE